MKDLKIGSLMFTESVCVLKGWLEPENSSSAIN